MSKLKDSRKKSFKGKKTLESVSGCTKGLLLYGVSHAEESVGAQR